MGNSNFIVNEMLNKEAVIENIRLRLKKSHQYKPYLTFSREPGSGGKPIAQIVAKKLGFKLFDRQILEEIAAKLHQSPQTVKHVDEHKRGVIMDMVQGMLNPDYISSENYFRLLCQTILKLIDQGGVVIVGRGANFIAPNAFGLEVHIVATYRARVANAVTYEHLNYQNAREKIKKVTKERALFVKQFFGKDISVPKYYDLTLNTTYLSLNQAADVIIHAYYAKFPQGKIPTQSSP